MTRPLRWPEPTLDELTADPTNKARQQRWRDRQAGKLAPAPKLVCVACGKVHTGARGDHCSVCWEKFTVEGRAFKAARVAKVAAKRRAAREGT